MKQRWAGRQAAGALAVNMVIIAVSVVIIGGFGCGLVSVQGLALRQCHGVCKSPRLKGQGPPPQVDEAGARQSDSSVVTCPLSCRCAGLGVTHAMRCCTRGKLEKSLARLDRQHLASCTRGTLADNRPRSRQGTSGRCTTQMSKKLRIGNGLVLGRNPIANVVASVRPRFDAGGLTPGRGLDPGPVQARRRGAY